MWRWTGRRKTGRRTAGESEAVVGGPRGGYLVYRGPGFGATALDAIIIMKNIMFLNKRKVTSDICLLCFSICQSAFQLDETSWEGWGGGTLSVSLFHPLLIRSICWTAAIVSTDGFFQVRLRNALLQSCLQVWFYPLDLDSWVVLWEDSQFL